MNREEWLTRVAQQVEERFKVRGYAPKNYKLTCGWPCRFGMSAKKRRVGECHSASTSKAGIVEIFISPVLEKPLEVAGTICHELVHAAVGNECGHKGKFVTACKHLGLVGKPTHAMPGKWLSDTLTRLLSDLPEYPHQALLPIAKSANKSDNNVKLVCICGCSIRISTKWLREAGPPTCGCGFPMQVQDDTK